VVAKRECEEAKNERFDKSATSIISMASALSLNYAGKPVPDAALYWMVAAL